MDYEFFTVGIEYLGEKVAKYSVLFFEVTKIEYQFRNNKIQKYDLHCMCYHVLFPLGQEEDRDDIFKEIDPNPEVKE